MGTPSLTFEDPSRVLRASDPGTVVLVGRKGQLLSQAVLDHVPPALARQMPALMDRLTVGDSAASTTTWLEGVPPVRAVVSRLPERASRHNAPGRPDQIEALLRPLASERPEKPEAVVVGVLLACADADEALAAAAAAARALPLYSRVSGGRGDLHVRLAVQCEAGAPPAPEALQILCEAIRDAGRLHDMPASELHTEALIEEAEALARAVGADCSVLRAPDLQRGGYGGLWNVGRAASRPPALVVLSHAPAHTPPARTVAWVGKGVVHDTGGLNLKSLAEMTGMKGDMAGAAAVLTAFGAAVRLGAADRLHALLCVADNAIGPGAMRPDDILTLRSGKTVEIVNTDCEGRLVLADGVAHAAQHLAPDVIVDLATLTDAAPVATGRRMAAIVSNDGQLEAKAVLSGRSVGELVHPLPYCPELHRPELRSELADMTNAPRDGHNANVSCAAQFIAEHLAPFRGPWLHVDLEGPSRSGEGRGSGFGVGLLLRLFGYV